MMSGRPGQGARAVGVDLGGTKCLAVAVDEAGAVVAEPHKVATPHGVEDVLDAVTDVVKQLSVAGERLTAVGVGVPGWVDRMGILQFAPNLVGVGALDMSLELGNRLGVPVYTENDATCAAWGEYRKGAGEGTECMILVTIGTGIGGGIVLDGKLHRGTSGFAGEVGHMVVESEGPRCGCGRRGCWEVVASGPALARAAQTAARAGKADRLVALAGVDVNRIRGEHVVTAVQEGDVEAQALLSVHAGWIALGLLNLANLFDPELFIIGGGLAAAGDTFFEPVNAALESLMPAAPKRPPIRIVPAALGEPAGAIGAACLAIGSGAAPPRRSGRPD